MAQLPNPCIHPRLDRITGFARVGHHVCVEFSYRLVGTGWAQATLADESASVTLTASYLEDALGDLLEAIGTMLEGAAEARCSWQEEPGEYRWVFHDDGAGVRLRVLGFADEYSRAPDSEGVPVFETHQQLRDIATAIADGAQEVLNRYGEAEYHRLWVDFPFPTAHLEMVRRRLSDR